MTDTAQAPTVQTHPTWWTDLDTKAVDTARLLAADAVQKVGNGHPGTAMSLAPLAYLLFQKVMRHDPTDPTGWPGPVHPVQRPLLAHPVHPAVPLRLRPGARRPKSLRTWGSLTPGHPGARPHHRRRDHHRPARPGRGQRGRHGDGGPPRARPARPRRRARRIAVRPPHLRHRRRRLPGGGHLQRGVQPGRAPGARQPHPALGRQPHLDRGRHQRRVLRGRARALRGLRLARAVRRLRRGRRRAGEGDRGGAGRDRPAVDHRGAHHHRLARADQAEHRQGPRLGPGRGRDPRDQGDPRLQPGRPLRRRRRGPGPHPPGRRPRSRRRTRSGSPAFDAWAREERPGARRCSTG